MGYLNRPEINEVRFIKTPSSLKEELGPRLYRTGDWGYLLADGCLEICGRCDTMVKIRGYSIEIQASTNVPLPPCLYRSCLGDRVDSATVPIGVVLRRDQHRCRRGGQAVGRLHCAQRTDFAQRSPSRAETSSTLLHGPRLLCFPRSVRSLQYSSSLSEYSRE